jgi:hypothetical protein
MAPLKKAIAGMNDMVSVLWCGINRSHDEELGKLDSLFFSCNF